MLFEDGQKIPKYGDITPLQNTQSELSHIFFFDEFSEVRKSNYIHFKTLKKTLRINPGILKIEAKMRAGDTSRTHYFRITSSATSSNTKPITVWQARLARVNTAFNTNNSLFAFSSCSSCKKCFFFRLIRHRVFTCQKTFFPFIEFIDCLNGRKSI